jgi:TetR/AcrR family transcriptional regulator, mexCD-oprJ operon repressor
MNWMAHPEPTPLRRRQALQERVTDLILEGALRAFARTEDASMSDVAVEAGVARATVYRHFPSREALIDRLIQRAEGSASRALDADRIDDAPIEDAIRRTIRVLVDMGDEVVVLNNALATGRSRAITSRVRGVMQRGQEAGVIGRDIPAAWLSEALVSSVVAVMTSDVRCGREDTVEKLARLFLNGASTAD